MVVEDKPAELAVAIDNLVPVDIRVGNRAAVEDGSVVGHSFEEDIPELLEELGNPGLDKWEVLKGLADMIAASVDNGLDNDLSQKVLGAGLGLDIPEVGGTA